MDLGSDVTVTKVIIFNRNDGVSAGRLSSSTVSLKNNQDTILKSYKIGNANNVASFTFP